ncbi:hypothetical protein TEA_019108 [Camellia sinensis var. sinensis]|uniref:Uncharacterized protein n=1 Tax=Camellia sinensis var. sinensis TaxID=542762 RepID=A0A4S4DA30_CAMSN|nr:hypothetical protein TEA_019108 [Camellia sinensis var. sinensis]
MAAPNPMKVIGVCRVAPTPSSPAYSAAQTSLPITFFDVLWLNMPPVKRLFFYEASYSSTTFSEIVLPKLKHSLSLTLHHYLPLASSLTWPPDSDKPIIQYVEGDDAVSLTIAESEADFHHLSSNSFREIKEIQPFLPNLPASDTRVPAMVLQITLFPNTGFSIGYATHHAVLDGKTATMFMQSWASICQRGGDSTLTPELTPFYDRTVIDDPDDLEKTYLNLVSKSNNKSLMILDVNVSPDAMLGTFQLTRSNIENMKKRVNGQWQEKHMQKPSIHVSTFTVTCAYVWVCLVKALKMKPGKVHLGFTVDCRARLEPPVPSTYFGNCVAAHVGNADSNDLIGEDGVAMAAKAIGEVIRRLSDRLLLNEVGLSELASVDMDRVFSIAGSPRFELYKTDFGWGRPRKVEITSIDKNGAFSLSESRDGDGGIQIGIMLKKHEIEAFASLFASDSNDLIGEDGVAMAAKAIGEVIRRLSDRLLLNEVGLSELASVDMDRVFSIAGSPRFELYKTDFGWGRPRKVEITSIDKNGAFSLSESRDGDGGLQIGIMLKKHEIEAFASLFASGLEAY